MRPRIRHALTFPVARQAANGDGHIGSGSLRTRWKGTWQPADDSSEKPASDAVPRRRFTNAEETKFFTLPVGKGKDRRLQIESRKAANWRARQNGLDMAFKIRGLYVREQENKGPEFSVVMIDRSYRPDWRAMRRTQPKIEAPGLPGHGESEDDQ